MKMKRLFARKVMLLALAVLTFTTAWADNYPEYITDIVVVGGSKTESVVKGYCKTYVNQGYTFDYKNLNEGNNGDVIYLGCKYSARESTNGGYITRLYVMSSSDKKDWKSSFNFTVDGESKTFYPCPVYDGGNNSTTFYNNHGDLNATAKGKYIWLYYSRGNFSDKRVISFLFVDNSSISNSYYTMGKNGNTSGTEGYNLNDGAGGNKLYMHYEREVKTNRPEQDPTLASGLVYNGKAQKLVTYNPTSNCTMWYSVDGGSYTSNISNLTATKAKTYTIRYYAASNSYGDGSATFSKTVEISKSSNSGLSVSISSTIYGSQNINPSLSGTNLSTGQVTFQYSTSSNGSYTSTKPTTPGVYYVKATVAGDDNCIAYTTASVKFTLADWQGSGTSSSPYLIKTVSDLKLLATRVNAGNKYKGIYFKVYNDIAFSGTNNFTAIGTSSSYNFQGTFDGDNKTISGININSSNSYQGLFGYLGEGGTVKNVVLYNSTITGGAEDVGGIVGACKGTLTGCFAKNVTVNSSSGKYYGAVCGYKYTNGSLSNNYYYNCKVAGTSNATNVGANKADVTANNGAVSVHTLSCGSYVTASTASITHSNVKYYAQGKTITLNYSGSLTNNQRINYVVTYGSTSTTYTTNTFQMPAANVSVTTKKETLYTITSNNSNIGITGTVAKTVGTTKYYAAGTRIKLSRPSQEADDKLFSCFSYKVGSSSYTTINDIDMPAGNITNLDVVYEQLYTITFEDNTSTASTAKKTSSNGTKYYKAGQTIQLAHGEVPGDKYFLNYKYTANGTTTTVGGSSFTMPAGNTTVNLDYEQLHTITFSNGVSSNMKPVGVLDGVKYYRKGMSILVSWSGTEDKIFNNFIVNGEALAAGAKDFIMPDQDTHVSADVEQLYTITFKNNTSTTTAARKTGNSGTKYYSKGTTVTLSCTLNDNQRLNSYTVNGNAITGNTFQMPEQNVTIGAEVETLYTLAFNNGVSTTTKATKTGSTGTKYYAQGTNIVLSCSVPEDKLLDKYVLNGSTISGTSFSMPQMNTSVGAQFQQLYTIAAGSEVEISGSVKTGSNGTKYYASGDQVTLYLDNDVTPAQGKYFHSFVANVEGLEKIESLLTGYRFDMPSHAVEVSVLWKDRTPFAINIKENSETVAKPNVDINPLMGYYSYQNVNTGEVIPALDMQMKMQSGEGVNPLVYVMNFDLNLDGETDMQLNYPSLKEITTTRASGANKLQANYLYMVENQAKLGITNPYNGLFVNFNDAFETEQLETLLPLSNYSKCNEMLIQSLARLREGVVVVSDRPVSEGVVASDAPIVEDGPSVLPYPVVLQGRTLWRDGDWNTICLPFDVDLTDESNPLYGAIARTMESASLQDETLKLTFADQVDKLEAGVPYIIKWETSETSAIKFVNPVFRNVVLNGEDNSFRSDDMLVRFVGNYDFQTFTEENQNILFLGAQNKMYYPDGLAPTKIGACRAYFKLGSDDVEVCASNIRNFVLDFGEDGTLTIENMPSAVDKNGDVWFSLDGQKLSGKPTQKGLFINNNKKVLTK